MTGIVIAVYSSFFMALAIASLKKSYRELEPSVAFFFDMLFGLAIWIPVSFMFGVNLSSFWTVLPYAIISAILSEALYFYTLSKGELSVTSILIGSYPIYTILFSYVFNNEVLTHNQLIFVSITIFGTLITYLPSKLNKEELKKSGVVTLAVITAIAIGFSDSISKFIIDQTADFTFLLALALVQIPVALIYLKIEKQSITKNLHEVKDKFEDYKNAIAGSLLNIIGTGLLWISFSKTYASLASPITATSGALVILFAVLFLDEKIRWRHFFGIVLVFIGIIGISIYS